MNRPGSSPVNGGRSQRSALGDLLPVLAIAALLSVAGCGGESLAGPSSFLGGSTSGGGGDSDGGGDGGFTPGQFEPASNFEALCKNPRSGTDPTTGAPFPDMQGSTLDENNWLRSWSNDLYLWYDEIADVNPSGHTTLEYFDLMKTFATTPSGAPKDKFHFTMPTDEWVALAQSGVSAGYGASFAILSPAPPREIVVAYTEPNSPASAQNIMRGATVISVDGVDVANGADADTLNAGLFPAGAGESHEFVIQDLGAPDTRTVTMVSALITSDPVQSVSVIPTASGPVGYMLFNDHIATAEQELIDAVNQLAAAGVTDLVLDMRYNGGGFLDIASELGFMIAGSAQTAGRTFEETQFNDKHTVFNPVTGESLVPLLFHQITQGFSTTPSEPLPSLNLPRVFVLTGPGTCSASEALTNALRGVDNLVIQVGSTTCGKPYGFYPTDNCGTTYFSIQFKGVNAKGFGDYPDGFTAANAVQTEGVPVLGCAVADDFTHQLGDPLEARLAAALQYRADGTCPAPTGIGGERLATSMERLSAVDGNVPKPVWLQNRILRR